MTTEEKNNAILNSGDDYEEILDIQYGKKGTPGRDAFDRDAEAFILHQCRTDPGTARCKDRHEKVLHLAHRKRQDRRTAVHPLQNLPGPRQKNQHHDTVASHSSFNSTGCGTLAPEKGGDPPKVGRIPQPALLTAATGVPKHPYPVHLQQHQETKGSRSHIINGQPQWHRSAENTDIPVGTPSISLVNATIHFSYIPAI